MRICGCSLLFLLTMASLAASGCVRKAAEQPTPKAPEVLVSVPIVREIVDFEEFTGRTEAQNAVEVKPRVTGDITKVNFKDGAMVNKGDVLFEIEPKLYEAELQRAEATLSQNDVRLKRLEAELQRAASLVLSKSISSEEFEKIKADRAEAVQTVAKAKAEAVIAKQNYDYTKIKAYISGRTSRRFVDAGNLAEKEKTVLTTIVSTDPMYVYFDVDERTVLRLRELVQKKKIKSVQQMEFEFGLANEERYPHRGKINFENNKIDPSTGTLLLRGEFANPDDIAPGLFARIRLLIGEPREALLVSERALATDQGQKYIYVVTKESKVEYRGLERDHIGPLIDGLRVLDKGVSAGEHVIVAGLQRVRPNAIVETKVVDMPGTNAGKKKPGGP